MYDTVSYIYAVQAVLDADGDACVTYEEFIAATRDCMAAEQVVAQAVAEGQLPPAAPKLAAVIQQDQVAVRKLTRLLNGYDTSGGCSSV